MINQKVLFGTFLSQGNIPLQALCYWNFFSPFEALLWLVRIEGNDYVMKPINFHSRRRAIQIEIVNYWHSRIFWGKADLYSVHKAYFSICYSVRQKRFYLTSFLIVKTSWASSWRPRKNKFWRGWNFIISEFLCPLVKPARAPFSFSRPWTDFSV